MTIQYLFGLVEFSLDILTTGQQITIADITTYIARCIVPLSCLTPIHNP